MAPRPGSVRPFAFAPAPAGTRVRVLTLFSFGVVALVAAIAAIVVSTNPDTGESAIAVLAAAASVPVVFLVWWCSRIRAYEIADGLLRVTGVLRAVTFPLHGLENICEDRKALEGARKTIGNDGLGSINGRFRSRKLGRFRAYVTDPEKAVVLRWPDRCVVVSPENPALFVETVRAVRAESRVD